MKDNRDEYRNQRGAGDVVPKQDYLGTSHVDPLYRWATRRDDAALMWRENAASTYGDAAQIVEGLRHLAKGAATFPVHKKCRQRGTVRFTNTATRFTDSHHVRVSQSRRPALVE